VLLSERTRVYDPEGYWIDHDELGDAEYVEVRGRLLAPRRWRANEDGDVVPTIRAKRIYVTEWSRRADDAEGEEPEPDDSYKDCEVLERLGSPGYHEESCER
jgi:hypothetical protein